MNPSIILDQSIPWIAFKVLADGAEWIVVVYADDDGDEDQFVRQARDARAEAEKVRQEFITFTNGVWHLDGFIKDDLPHLAKAIEAQARLVFTLRPRTSRASVAAKDCC